MALCANCKGKKNCPECKGSGKASMLHTCGSCGGKKLCQACKGSGRQ